MFNTTHYSFHSVSKPQNIAKRYKELGYRSCILADYGTLCGTVDFVKSCKEHQIKPVIGVTLENRVLLAKNLKGYYELVKLVNSSPSTFSRDELPNCIIIENLNDVINHFIKYSTEEEKEDYDLMSCSINKTSLEEEFIDKTQHHIISPSELKTKFTTEQIRKTRELIDLCEDFDIKRPPILPKFSEESEINIVRRLCTKGWDKRNKNWGQNYKDRIRYELKVLEENNLSGYFLIIQDIINWAKNQGILVGPARGSSAGCFVSYLLGITEIDPIQYGLIFERFFNPGRKNTLPDIDVDFPTNRREEVFEYIRNKYGKDKVAQIATYGGLKGRAALKEVLRLHNVLPFEAINKLTADIPDPAKISDKMEEEKETSVLNWILNNEPDMLSSLGRRVDGKIIGEHAKYLEQAIRIEGIYKSRGKHAAGIIVSSDRLSDYVPMVSDKSDEKIVGYDLSDAEYVGLVKFDILSVAALDKLSEF